MAPGKRRLLVVVTDNRFGELDVERGILEPAGFELREASCTTEGEVAEACANADAVLVNLAPMGATAIAGLRRCKAIVRYGVGLDNVDLEAAAEKNIAVHNVPGYCDEEVAAHALALALDLVRSTTRRDRAVRSGDWNVRLPTPRLSTLTLGILGFGGTGAALARMAAGIGFARILAWSPSLDQARIDRTLAYRRNAGSTRIISTAFGDLLAASDLVSLHLGLNSGTKGMLGAREFALMKEGTRLINVARGALIDEAALLAALESGKLAGAALDVNAIEPLPPENPLRSRDDVVLTDHAAWYSDGSVLELRKRAAELVLRSRPRASVTRDAQD
ncbi:MAG: C-terminal binding protein [Spirochaetales bacterium]|nr:C-terminal binding protein [Spirochaetales bacterium]